MARAAVIQTTFNAGEISPLLAGRVDLAKYSNGTKLSENFMLSVQGPAIRRAGTRFVGPVKNQAQRTWMLDFQFNTEQAYVLEFGDGYIRFFANHGQVVVSGVAAWVTATAYKVGDLAVQSGVNYYCAVAHAAGTFVVDLGAGKWHALTGDTYEIPSPYASSDLTAADDTLVLRFAQSADVIYIAHPNFQPQKLSRFGATNWTMTPLQNAGGPFKDQSADSSSTVYATGAAFTPGSSVTLNASKAIFDASMVGTLFYLQQQDVSNISQWVTNTAYSAGAVVRAGGVNYTAASSATSGNVEPSHTFGTVQDGAPGVAWAYSDPGYAFLQITGFTDSQHVTATALTTIPAGARTSANASQRWAKGAWNSTDGYPSQVTFFRERLTFFAGQSMWFSVTGDYENFDKNDLTGNIVADGAITSTIVARTVNQAQWADAGADLLIGTAGGEFRCSEMTANQVFGPGNITVKQQSSYGSKGVAAQRVGTSLVYIQRSGHKVRELAYDAVTDTYKSTDLTALSEHIGKGPTAALTGLVASDFQQEPYSIIWNVRRDGMLVGFTFNREQDVVGFHRHPIGGGGIVEAVRCIPTPDGTRDELWLIVRRTINGQTTRYVEFLEVEHQTGGPGIPSDDVEEAFYVDSGLTFDGSVTGATLTPGAGAAEAHQTGVPFAASAPVFASSDVSRSIHYRYLDSTTDESGDAQFEWKSGKALITAFIDAQNVECTIDAAFPNAATIPAGGWRMTVMTITGLDHLEGQMVDVLNNGASHPQVQVQGGAIALQYPSSYANVGLPCPCRLWTMRLNAGAQDGTSQGKTARIDKLAIRFLDTIGAKYGPSPYEELVDLPFRETQDPMDQPPSLFTGDKVVDFPGDYSFEPEVFLMNDQPFPTAIVAIMPTVSTYDRG